MKVQNTRTAEKGQIWRKWVIVLGVTALSAMETYYKDEKNKIV